MDNIPLIKESFNSIYINVFDYDLPHFTLKIGMVESEKQEEEMLKDENLNLPKKDEYFTVRKSSNINQTNNLKLGSNN